MKNFKILWQLVLYKPWIYIFSAILWVLFGFTPIFPGLLSEKIFDALSGKAQAGFNIWGAIALLAAAQLARIVINFASSGVDATFSQTTSSLLRRNIVNCFAENSAMLSQNVSLGATINSLRDDVDEVSNFFTLPAYIVGLLLFAIVAFYTLIQINLRLTLLVFLPLFGILILYYIVSSRIQKFREENRKATADAIGFLDELMNAVQAIKIAGTETPILNHFQKLNYSRYKIAVKDRLIGTLTTAIIINAVDIGTGLILLLAAREIRAGSFTIGNYAIFVYYLGWIMSLNYWVGWLLARYKQACVSLNRLQNLLPQSAQPDLVKHEAISLKEKPFVSSVRPANDHQLNSFEVKDLTYQYPTSEGGIFGVNLSLSRGSLTVITGRVGSGKTTLLRAILGLLPRQAGEMYWNGQIVSDPAQFFLPPLCAYTPQQPRLFSGTIKENILLGIPENHTDLENAIYQSVLNLDLSQMPEELDTAVGSRGMRLSGGQVQRVATARMFVRNPELYVVDDLSSALDAETERTIWKRFLACKDITCIAVTHHKATLEQADQVIVMKDGKVESIGKLRTLLTTSEEMQKLWCNN